MNNRIPDKEEAELEGRWRPFKGELAGEDAPELVLSRTEFTLLDGRYTVRFDREISDEGTYSLATTPTHRTLTLRGNHGPNAGRTIPSIYQHVGDRLRICYGLDGVLPTDFTAPSETQRYLVTYRRARGSDE